MLIAEVIVYLSIAAWFFPVFKQFKHKYYYLFLILALGDSITMIMYELFKFDVERSMLITALLMVFSFLSIYKKHFFIYSLTVMLLGYLALILVPINEYILKFIIMILLLIMVFFVLKALIIDSLTYKSISLFYLILFVYVLSLALKFYITLTLVLDSIVYYHITTIFEIVVAIFFTFYNEENAKRIKLEG
jgi:hypothetical protein